MRITLALKSVVGLAFAATLGGCTILMDINEQQCEVDSDCNGGRLDYPVCVDNVCQEDESASLDGACVTDRHCGEPTPRCMSGECVSTEVAERWMCEHNTESQTETVNYGFHVVEFLSRMPPADMVVNACRNNDISCSDPVATYTDTSGEGFARFELPSGFFGYFEIVSDALPSLLYVTQPIVTDSENRAVPVLQMSTVELTALVAGFDFDAEKGLAILVALDCTGNPAGGVQFTESTATADQFYIVDQVPSKEAKVSVYSAADNTADGGFINLAPGFVTFAARLGEDGIPLGSFNAQIRPSTITFIDLDF